MLIQGQREHIRELRGSRDAILIESSREDLPSLDHAKRACIIFLGAVAMAATGMMPIVVAAFAGAIAMVATDVLNLRQAFRAIDPKIATAIAAALAMSISAQGNWRCGICCARHGRRIRWAWAACYYIDAVLDGCADNQCDSNNAVAVLLTPIAVDLANEVGSEPMLFAIAMVFAVNCSFASPMGLSNELIDDGTRALQVSGLC